MPTETPLQPTPTAGAERLVLTVDAVRDGAEPSWNSNSYSACSVETDDSSD